MISQGKNFEEVYGPIVQYKHILIRLNSGLFF